MQISADGIRNEARLQRGNCLAEPEATTTVSHIEYDTALLSGYDEGLQLALVIDDRLARTELRKAVGEDVAGTKVLHEEVLD